MVKVKVREGDQEWEQGSGDKDQLCRDEEQEKNMRNLWQNTESQHRSYPDRSYSGEGSKKKLRSDENSKSKHEKDKLHISWLLLWRNRQTVLSK